MSDSLSRNGQAAVDYVQRGFAVFPCCWPDTSGKCACGRNHQGHDVGKAPLTKNGKGDATRTAIGAAGFWTRWPNANVAWAITPDKVVLDNDREKGGYESLGVLQDRYGALPQTRLHITGNLGQHYLYETPVTIKNTTRLDGLNGLDIRGFGGYIIMPPSLHQSGRRYTVSHIWDGPIMPAPAWLIKVCLKRQPAVANTNAHDPIPEGARNDTLTRDAGAMRRRGMSEAAIYAALTIENRERCQPPLLDSEIQRIAASVARYAPDQTPTQPPQRQPKELWRGVRV